LNKLYANITPEQRANHPGFRRLLSVIQLEQELNDNMTQNALGYTQPERAPERKPMRPDDSPKTTAVDRKQQEERLGMFRNLGRAVGGADDLDHERRLSGKEVDR